MELQLQLDVSQVILQAAITIKKGDTVVAEGYANVAWDEANDLVDVEEWDIDNWVDDLLTDAQVAKALTQVRGAIELAAKSRAVGALPVASITVRGRSKSTTYQTSW